jgi:hypothetical protein
MMASTRYSESETRLNTLSPPCDDAPQVNWLSLFRLAGEGGCTSCGSSLLAKADRILYHER